MYVEVRSLSISASGESTSTAFEVYCHLGLVNYTPRDSQQAVKRNVPRGVDATLKAGTSHLYQYTRLLLQGSQQRSCKYGTVSAGPSCQETSF